MIIKKVLLFFIIFLSAVHAENKTETDNTKIEKYTNNKFYKISYMSQLAPITINTMHSWVLHIVDENGDPVLNADIMVSGGMPEHDHGLPTTPQMTQNLGGGNYLLEGMRFHMGGLWQITITVHEDNKNDRVTFELQL